MIPTPHIEATKDQIAKIVIMPGDPRRSKMIAETFLENPVLVNDVRGVQGYTGTYKGQRFTVMASGMGHPSIGLYSYELYNFYDVDTIIRVGSIGGVSDRTPLRSLIIGQRAYSETNYLMFYRDNGNKCGYVEADETLCAKAAATAERLGFEYNVGDIMSSDTYYTDNDDVAVCLENNLLGVEMEGVALYLNAKRAGKKALVICTVSNNIPAGIELPSEDRQNGFKDMARLAFEMCL
ncbi:MAG: purine-nucleoside phosphorylase [Bacteroidales bacterium]|nr:purine-nucleoside phosphorylase [Bacteroidales bacterium]